jgi:hypothetical protein
LEEVVLYLKLVLFKTQIPLNPCLLELIFYMFLINQFGLRDRYIERLNLGSQDGFCFLDSLLHTRLGYQMRTRFTITFKRFTTGIFYWYLHYYFLGNNCTDRLTNKNHLSVNCSSVILLLSVKKNTDGFTNGKYTSKKILL